MRNIAIVYWSGTGNTEAMAEAIKNSVEEKGGNATLYEASDFSSNLIDNFDAIAFGCPAMGAEVLEEEEFEPMFSSCKPKLTDKDIALFGSYGWGDGEWMRNWEDECEEDGITLCSSSVICQDEPDNKAIENCKNLASDLMN